MSVRSGILWYSIVAVAIVILLAGFLATNDSVSASEQSEDGDFAAAAIRGGMTEVNLGRLAAQKGTTQAVRTFGEKMVDDHSKANDKLKEIAAREKMELPADIGAQEQANIARLSKLSGRTFDREYANLMVKDHEKDVEAFQNEAKNGKNAYIKQFAGETLPTIQEHLRQAQGLTSASAR
jgi:putative membrane protein